MTKHWLANKRDSGDNKSRKREQALRIIQCLAKLPNAATIPLLAEKLKLSVPTITRFISELHKQDLIVKQGKISTESGRQPTVHSINKKRFYSLGVEISLNRLQISLVSIDLSIKKDITIPNFILEDNDACFTIIANSIIDFTRRCKIPKEHIIGVGVGITGRVNTKTGKTYNYFASNEIAFAKRLENKIKMAVIVDNDTRAIGLLELIAGKAKQANNAIIVNIGSGIATTIVSNNTITTGHSGFAGEFGHMQFVGNQNRLCICGKKGCLDTEVSGKALLVDLSQKLAIEPHPTYSNMKEINYNQILEEANGGDLLAITLLQKQGEKLGYALGNLINLLNPEKVVISGKYAQLDNFFIDSVKSALYQSGLRHPLNDCKLVKTELGNNAGCIGAAAFLFAKYNLI